MTNIITYFIASDYNRKLEKSAKTACNMWNDYVEPKMDIIIRLEVFNKPLSGTTGIAYKPYEINGKKYCRVTLNKRFLKQWDDNKIAGTVAHEIGHALGFGWEEWMNLVNTNDGSFTSDAIKTVPALSQMRIHLGGNYGTKWSHWDEALFDQELMTPFKDNSEHVLPVTIDVLELLGHKVKKRLHATTSLVALFKKSTQKSFDLKKRLPLKILEKFEETEVFETLPHSSTS